ncbi:RGG repeats nuclear RNA binding protein C-like [Papaver somniferum]|uniref:RGG repeats nuclear RNA binding protein C-like n=1 Tax=Papaver somniferum TaxID=3469 RepID=UPI000E7010DF|nr:RGG repeats nuclear RNA binding protein C-like [Papaver somniferum]
MATSSVNPFGLLHGDDAGCEDLSVLVAKVVSATKITHPSLVKEKPKNVAQLPSKPLSPAEYVRTGGRGTGRGTGGRGIGRGTGGQGDNNHTDSNGNRGYTKNENVKTSDVTAEKEEDKEMSLAEFEKVRLEKKKALNAVKSEERKVVDNEFKNLKILGKKKDEELSIKPQKSGKGNLKKKESLAEEKARKSIALHEFLKPVEHEKSDNNGKGSDNGAQGDRNGPPREGSSEQPDKKEIKRAIQGHSTWLSAVKGG